MNKKIAFLIMDMDKKGGTERVTSMIANSLSNNNEVYIFSCKNGESPHFFVKDNVKLESLHGEKSKNSLFRKMNVFKELYRKINKYDIDIAIAVDVALYLYLFPLNLLHYCKCISWEHFNYFYSPNRRVKLGRRLSAKYADSVVVLGKNDLSNYKKNFSKIKNIRYIFNPVSVSVSNTNDNMEYKRIVAAGRLENEKGFDRLVDIWAQIENDFIDWKLDIFGEGSECGKLQSRISSLGLKNIKLRGYADDISKELENSSIFVLTSRFEGFGLVLIEAQAKGLPCVSFDKEGPSEIINDGVNGFLVNDGNISDFADKLKLLMKNKSLRYSFSNHATDEISRYDLEKISKEWEELVEEL